MTTVFAPPAPTIAPSALAAYAYTVSPVMASVGSKVRVAPSEPGVPLEVSTEVKLPLGSSSAEEIPTVISVNDSSDKSKI